MTRLRLLLLLPALLLLLPLLRPAPADGSEAIRMITVSPGGRETPLALPMPEFEDGQDEVARTIWEVVRRNLDMTGFVRIIDPDAYIDRSGGVAPGTFAFDDWRVIHATALVKTLVRPHEGGVRADLHIYDVNAGQRIEARAFAGSPAEARYLGHRISDAILLALTGEPGFFGSRLLAVGERTGNKEVYVLDIDGEGVLPVTRNRAINLSPAWAPSGGQVAWTSYKRGNPDLYVKDLASGRTRVLSSRPGINVGAAFSPDGSRVALARSEGADADIFVIDAHTGNELQRITRGGGIDVAPDWSPDGRMLAWASERSGGSQVHVQELEGGQARRVTFQGGFNVDPVFSPDGQRIAFVGRDRNFDIFTVGVDGRGMQRITQDMGDNEDPSWSHCGRYLVFSSTRTGRREIWLSTADGRHQVQITRTGGWSQPSWSPF